jgi:Holliday junction resolvase RusA-like endonuclease
MRAAQDREVVAFVAKGRPFTSNKTVKAVGDIAKKRYGQAYAQAAGGRISNDLCYVIVWYFAPGYKPGNDPDAGNVHKRVLDGMEGKAYDDDNVARIVISGVIDYGRNVEGTIRLEEVDLSHMPRRALRDFAALIDKGLDHFLYVEVGPLRRSMYRFNAGSVAE